jgi:hypothetical protein
VQEGIGQRYWDRYWAGLSARHQSRDVGVIPAFKNAGRLVWPSPIEGLVDELGYQGRGCLDAVFGNPSAGPDCLWF